jgi:hypothetical protein
MMTIAVHASASQKAASDAKPMVSTLAYSVPAAQESSLGLLSGERLA